VLIDDGYGASAKDVLYDGGDIYGTTEFQVHRIFQENTSSWKYCGTIK
jgi:hypothetical protein